MIIIDDREHLTEENKKVLGENIRIKHLELGDFIISNDDETEIYFIYERKSYSDLCASVNDGRLIKQIHEIRDNIKNKTTKGILAINGDGSQYPQSHIKIARAISYSNNFELQKFSDKNDFFIELYEVNQLIEHKKEKNNELILNPELGNLEFIQLNNLKCKKSAITKDNFLSVVLSTIPGISPKSAISISTYYNGNFREFINGIENDIDEIEKKLTKRIINKNIRETLLKIF